ncbi:MAG: YggS family pyridoxal phosphate-dependent enzyme [Candidatus Hodarchaeales archaeon]|jgi:pyridoxal phosphate enzyme (YggS family)
MEPLKTWIEINDRIKKAALSVNQNPNNITIVGVTKRHPIDIVNKFILAGLTNIGENVVQEAEKKFSSIQTNVRKHLIGPLQSNKVNKAVELFDIIQTVDREKIIRKIALKAKDINKIPFPVFFQVNYSGEKTKHGCSEQEAYKLAEIAMSEKYENILSWQGLMTIAPLSAIDKDQKIEFYESFQTFFKEISSDYPNCKELSMGMSQSYEEAITKGATVVRIGTALFGQRS